MSSKKTHFESIVEKTLEKPDYANRLRFLRCLENEHSPALIEALLSTAHSEMRRDPGLAAQCARLARFVARRVKDERSQIKALRAFAQCATLLGRFGPALRALDLAIPKAMDAGDAEEVLGLDVLRIHPLVHLERYDDARATGRRALDLYERVGDRKGKVRVHMALADLAFRLDQPREALRHYAAVHGLVTPDTPARFRAVLAANRATALEARNRFQAAARHFAEARRLFADAGCEHSFAQVKCNEAYADALRGQYESALRKYAETEEAFTRLGDERHLALIDVERAEIHLHLNLPAEASALAARAEERFAALGMQKDEAVAAHLTGRAAELDGHNLRAEASLLRAQTIFTDLGLAERQVACLVHLASIAVRDGNHTNAHRLLDRAADLLDGEANPLSRVSLSLVRARLHLAEGRPTDALHLIDEARIGCRRIHAPGIHIEAHRLMAQAYVARSQFDEGLLAYKHAIDELERYRGGVPPDEYMAAFLAGRSDLYAEIVPLLVRAGCTELAFEYTERSKSRALVDLLADRVLSDASGDVTWSARRIAHLRERLNAVYQRIFRHTTGHDQRSATTLRRARRQAGELEDEIARLLREARTRDPAAAALAAVDTPNLEAVQRDLEPDTALLEYLVTPTELLTFLVTRRSCQVVRQELPTAELRRLHQRFRFHLARFDHGAVADEEILLEATRANLAKLTEILLEPVAERLDTRRIIVVPHGLVHNVPFHALPWGDGWMADRFEIVYAPSAAVYGFCRRRATPSMGPACVFGLPDEVAPEIAREARQVARALDSDVLYLGEEATLAELREQAAQARILHVATHGMFSPERPTLSSIRMADGWLNLYDIYGLDLCAELVVLSACESGIADVTDGNEILGLSRGFLCAGARALLASQWRVDDASTAEFMGHFYGHLQEEQDAAAALKLAMAEIRRTRPHPYYWAPFFLTGSPAARHTGGPRRESVRITHRSNA